MAHVTLSRPSFGTLQAAAPSRLVTEARVMHKAVKKMTRNRPKKHNPSDRRHAPTKYPELPPAPPQYTVLSTPGAKPVDQQ